MRVKICGITSPEDAEACVALGADMLGVNFVDGSPRAVDIATAAAIADAVAGRAEFVGVVADLDLDTMEELRLEACLDRLQLHGDEPPELVRRLGPHAFKALRIGSAADVAQAARYEGLLLVDAKVPGARGGTGQRIDVALIAGLARTRQLILAGGLTPGNVAAAIRDVAPWGVDVASGVERAPGVKDLDATAAFIRAARGC